MINFKSVTLTNFMSYGDKPTTFSLDNEGTTLILGENKDTSGDNISRNGSGKSSAIQALVFALYNKGLDKLKADEFVNITNGKRLEVVLEFEKGGHEYKISRRRKPSGVDLFIDGESHTLDSMANTDKLIQEIIGMPYEVFLTSFFLTPHNTSFMAMSGPEQRSLIESMLSLDVLAKRAESLKSIKKDLEVDLKLIERDLQNAKSQNASAEENVKRLEAIKNKWDKDHEHTLKSLREELVIASGVDSDALLSEWKVKQETKDKVQKLQEQISETKLLISKEELELSKLQSGMKSTQATIDEWNCAIQQVEQWETDHANNITQLEVKQTHSIEEIDEKINEIDILISEAEQRRSIESEMVSIEKEVDVLVSRAESLNENIEKLKSGVCYTCGQSHTDEEMIKTEESKRDDLLTTVEELISKQDVLSDDLSKLTTLSRSDLSKEQASMNALKNEMINIRNQIEHLSASENPHSKRISVFEEKGVTLQEMEENVSYVSTGISDSMSMIEDCKNVLEALIEEVNSLKTTTFPLLEDYGIESVSQIEEMKSLVSSIKADIKKKEKETNPYDGELDFARTAFVDLSEIEGQCDELTKDITHCQYLVKLLTDNKSFVRKNIVDKYIPLVNKKIVEYTELLGLKHVPSINSDLSTDIEYMNKSVSYYNLSQGERLRTNLAVSLAFRHLMKSLGNDTNLLIIDEYFDSGGDAVFLQKAFYLTQSQAPTVLMVSHRDEYKEIVDRTITIVKENGFSRVE